MSYASEQGVLNAQYNAAVMAQQAEEQRMRPSVLFRPKVFVDGSGDYLWCALYGDNIQDGVAGFGSTPNMAMLDFDANWTQQK